MITRKCERCGQASDGWRYCLECARGMYRGWQNSQVAVSPRDVSPTFICPGCGQRTVRGVVGYVLDTGRQEEEVCAACFDA